MRKLLAHLIYYTIRLWAITYRFKFNNPEKSGRGVYIYAGWHRNIIGTMMGLYGDTRCAMVSQSKDGELIAHTLKKLNVIPARGSSTRGGKEALIEMIRLVKSGIPAALTIDGPKGPACKAKPGVIELARQTGVPIIPVSAKAIRAKIFNSWDKFILPLPFTTITITFGEPIYIKEDISTEDFSRALIHLEDQLNLLQ